jgi:hypothetical protein
VVVGERPEDGSKDDRVHLNNTDESKDSLLRTAKILRMFSITSKTKILNFLMLLVSVAAFAWALCQGGKWMTLGGLPSREDNHS